MRIYGIIGEADILYIYWTFIFLRIISVILIHFSIGFKDFFHLINLYEVL